MPPSQFTVIVPARNAAATIDACLASLLGLKPCPREIIVVDDASSDATSDTALRRGVKVLRMPTNIGPGVARNEGARAATGNFLAFTDADCVVPQDWLVKLEEALADGRYAGATGPYAGTLENTLLSRLMDQTLRYSQISIPSKLESCISSNFCVRRSEFLAAGGFPSYRLPFSRMAHFGNEDEDMAYLMARKMGKPFVWLRGNGVYHAYRATLMGFFRQQASYAEAILISHSRYPEMIWSRSNYSRSGGAMLMLAALLACGSLLCLPFSGWAVLGVIPFLWSHSGCFRFILRNAENGAERRALLIAGYPYFMVRALAWTKGLVFGCVKGAAAIIYWRIHNREDTAEINENKLTLGSK